MLRRSTLSNSIKCWGSWSSRCMYLSSSSSLETSSQSNSPGRWKTLQSCSMWILTTQMMGKLHSWKVTDKETAITNTNSSITYLEIRTEWSLLTISTSKTMPNRRKNPFSTDAIRLSRVNTRLWPSFHQCLNAIGQKYKLSPLSILYTSLYTKHIRQLERTKMTVKDLLEHQHNGGLSLQSLSRTSRSSPVGKVKWSELTTR